MGGQFYLNYTFSAGGRYQENKEEGGDNGEFSLSSLSFCPPHLPLGYELTGTLVKIRESLGIIIWV